MTTAHRRFDTSAAPRAAVIGCGPIGLLHARAVLAAPAATLIAVCDPDRPRRAHAARQFGVAAFPGVEQLLAEAQPDVVTIATPDHLHLEPALHAIAAGCHVFCEKPLAADARQAERLVRAAADRPVCLGVDYNRRFAFGYRTAKRLLDEGAIGAARHCRLTVSDRTPPATVARHPLVIFTTLLTHHFDLLHHFCGPIRSLAARAGHQGVEPLLRDVRLSFELAGGATGTIEAGYRDELTATVERMELSGSQGNIVVAGVLGPVHRTGHDGRRQSSVPQHAETFNDSIIAAVQAFVDCTARGACPPVTGDDGLRSLQWAAAAGESIHSGNIVPLGHDAGLSRRPAADDHRLRLDHHRQHGRRTASQLQPPGDEPALRHVCPTTCTGRRSKRSIWNRWCRGCARFGAWCSTRPGITAGARRTISPSIR